jgi:hypothetical protein
MILEGKLHATRLRLRQGQEIIRLFSRKNQARVEFFQPVRGHPPLTSNAI